MEKNNSTSKEKENTNSNMLSKKIYLIGQLRTYSPISLTFLSLSLSQNLIDSSLTDSLISLNEKISLAICLIARFENRKFHVAKIVRQPSAYSGEEVLRRCNWLTRKSSKLLSRLTL